MKQRLEDYLNTAFARYRNFPDAQEVKQELLANLVDRFEELRSKGHDDETALR